MVLYGRLDAIYMGFHPRIEGTAVLQWIPDFQHIHLPNLFTTEECEARVAGIKAIRFTSTDVVRRDLVARIVDAYEADRG